jgi:hypothetical protein
MPGVTKNAIDGTLADAKVRELLRAYLEGYVRFVEDSKR